MKRSFTAILCLLLLFSLCSCAGRRTAAQLQEAMRAPLTGTYTLTFGEVSSTAQLNFQEGVLTLGFTDGILDGAVVSIDESYTRCLYHGVDVTFSKSTTKTLESLRTALLRLPEADFHPKNATETDGVLQYEFSYKEGFVTCTVDVATHQLQSLSVGFGPQPIQIIRNT